MTEHMLLSQMTEDNQAMYSDRVRDYDNNPRSNQKLNSFYNEMFAKELEESKARSV